MRENERAEREKWNGATYWESRRTQSLNGISRRCMVVMLEQVSGFSKGGGGPSQPLFVRFGVTSPPGQERNKPRPAMSREAQNPGSLPRVFKSIIWTKPAA
ncbi:hypothetical protein TEQG_04719 [Trichophyton equinum CBS 127.97]|uniref:Uncharacterized protein n=1 Tax=Trichophyton equinum (strain ATCC MYA-4606 / CBS 127.97) TaxID=559882 RepID=F2PUZ3_TRIEC|nr:hypothetical protein TEQG_04719 [Trichophyton equinum CBS 127.97]